MTPALYPWLRHGVQVLVVALLALSAYLAWPGHPPGESSRLEGTVWAGQILGLELMDPLAGLQTLVSGQARLPKVLLAIATPLILTLLLGRVFCSWICPAGLFFEMGDWLRQWLARRGFKTRGLRLWPGTKFVLLAVGVMLTVMTAIPLLGQLYPPALVSRELHGAVFAFLGRESGPSGPVLTGISLFLFFLILVEASLSPRLWCRSLCPGGALYSLFGFFRVVRVKRRASACTDCALCVPACPMGLNPMKGNLGLSCDNCLECISSCPDSALALGFGQEDAPGRVS